MTSTTQPAVEGWFDVDPAALVGCRCDGCGDIAFPPVGSFCANPACAGTQFTSTRLSTWGRIWSYTDARYQPPPPFVPRTDPYESFALAAVELELEQIVVLGQIADGYGVDDLVVGGLVDLVVEPLYEIDGVVHVMWRWRPRDRGPERGANELA